MGVRQVYLGVAAVLVSLAAAPAVADSQGDGAATQVGASKSAGFGSGAGVPLGAAYDNPRSPRAAVAWARDQVGSDRRWSELCLNFTARAYGWSYSGTQYAIDHYLNMPAGMRHAGDWNPPLGALLFWDTGRRAGHVALGLGDGMIASNDINVPGGISVVPADAIAENWGGRYLGWTAPYFPDAGIYVEPEPVAVPDPSPEPKPEPAPVAEDAASDAVATNEEEAVEPTSHETQAGRARPRW